MLKYGPMRERLPRQEPLSGFAEQVEPIQVIEIGCGFNHDGTPTDDKTGRMYDLPYVYRGIELEEEFIETTSYIKPEKISEARATAIESGIIFGNAADLPFEDETVDVVKMRSVFGQFTGKDYRELDNIVRFGLREAFRVLKPGGIIAVSEENTPWDEHDVFDYLNAVGFSVIDYSAMQTDWQVAEKRDYRGYSVGDFKPTYAPENREWEQKLRQFYGDEFGFGFLSRPRQYLMIGQKQQTASLEKTFEWREWSVAEDKFSPRGSKPTSHQKTYKFGKSVVQDFLPGMYIRDTHGKGQQELFYMQPKYFY